MASRPAWPMLRLERNSHIFKAAKQKSAKLDTFIHMSHFRKCEIIRKIYSNGDDVHPDSYAFDFLRRACINQVKNTQSAILINITKQYRKELENNSLLAGASRENAHKHFSSKFSNKNFFAV
ncbi:unnamed protein product [Zymoseptoria tritici ST99CH_1A5]|uniref:Uncharacterized protein n=1 Tax=Zymoseptoria tritici ST99CH_1A5 TaxID=1276529 RepID=A0A1Y6LUZ9_ZYMTR|nr:unnamed protein product [Zymoseptoria tritici ST99CH_1A5]